MLLLKYLFRGWQVVFCVAALAVCSASRLTAAPTHILETASGERLVGALVSNDGTTIRFRSESLGEVTLPANAAKVSSMLPASDGVAAQTPGWVKTTPPPAPPRLPNAPEEPSPWKRMIEAGYSYQSSVVSRNDVYARGELVFARDAFNYRLWGKYLYGVQEDVNNVNKVEAGLAARHDISGRWIFRNDLNFQDDRLRMLDMELINTTGVSWLLCRGPRFRLSFGPGLAVRYREPTIGHSGYTLDGDLSNEMSWKITERISITQQGSFLCNRDRLDEYRIRSTTVLTGRMTEQISLNVRHEYEFDHGRPVSVGRIDQRVFTTIGYTF